MGFDLDLSFAPDDAQALEAGNVRQPGWYRAIVHDVTEEHDKGFWELHYRVTAGPWAGSTIKDKLWKPENAADTAKAETSTKRIKLVLKRLGVWDGVPGQRKISLADAIGKECWLKLGERTYKGQDGQPAKSVDVEWAGIYPIDDERVPPEVRNPGSGGGHSSARASARKPAAPHTPTPPLPPAKPMPDYSDL